MLDDLIIIKLIKFCFVGLSGMMVDFGVTWLLKEKIKTNKYVANSCGFVAAASSNYLLNRFWTFESTNSHIATEYVSFFVISLAGLGINNLIIWLLADRLKMNFYLSKIIATVLVTIWNFGMNYTFTFAAMP